MKNKIADAYFTTGLFTDGENIVRCDVASLSYRRIKHRSGGCSCYDAIAISNISERRRIRRKN